ncbi:hypothetical protein FRC11_006990 [Ceratobasidium sp. 423]|nr:hypothetical protein FRC11_006990 [Ceratobasidium sp. 423]
MPPKPVSGKPVSKGSTARGGPEAVKMAIEVENVEQWEEISGSMIKSDWGRTATDEDRRMQELINQYHLGYALLQFGGPGSIHGLLPDVTNPPRVNPRPLDANALADLIVSVAETGVRDRINAMVAKMRKSAIPEQTLQQMGAADPTDLTSFIPVLDVVRRCPAQERSLETEQFTEYRGGRLLSAEDLDQVNEQLAALRHERDDDNSFKLVNGFHRLQMMLLRFEALEEKRQDLMRRVRSGDVETNLQQEFSVLREKLHDSTYLVSVFDMDTPQDLLLQLAENETMRPVAAPSDGEKIWMATKKQEAIIAVWQRAGIIDNRVVGLNKLNGPQDNIRTSWDLALYGESDVTKLLERIPAITGGGTPAPIRTAKDHFKGLSHTIMAHPSTMEMACDTRGAMPVWSRRVKDMHARCMVREGGACFVAHTWQALALIQQVCSIKNPVNVHELRKFVRDNQENGLDREGLPEASGHMKNILHQADSKDNVSRLLIDYEGVIHEEAQTWASSHLTEEEGFHVGETDFTSDRAITASRLMREQVGLTLRRKAKAANDERLSMIGLALRVSARLPLWQNGCDEFHFFPAQMLPTRHLFQAYSAAIPVGSDSAGCLVTRLQYVSALNIPADLLNERLLVQASEVLEGAHLRQGLQAVNVKYPDNMKKIKADCGVTKSGSPSHPILVEFATRHGDTVINARALEARFDLVVDRLVQLAFTEPDVNEFKNELEKNPALQMIDPDHWNAFGFFDWLQGWPDKKHKGSVRYGLGWALMGQHLRDIELPNLFKESVDSRKLLTVVKDTLSPGDTPMWWERLGYTDRESESASEPGPPAPQDPASPPPPSVPDPNAPAVSKPSDTSGGIVGGNNLGTAGDTSGAGQPQDRAGPSGSHSHSASGSDHPQATRSDSAQRQPVRKDKDSATSSNRAKRSRDKPFKFDGVHLPQAKSKRESKD